eukprot:CAMPEP_0168271282 /NCGR_PEP_ID=MMETSP0141_2-20121125/15509_1 /TAXON_ID=44445 /ORGANISM="Pseudo-nitzschia australis, Strain 10249 10 AB" /LENGTH=523 /DNA_ID=CAMNT_0008212447 /DNA_START=41 /DNA_END=1608 /DNA_ORIENTATION=+
MTATTFVRIATSAVDAPSVINDDKSDFMNNSSNNTTQLSEYEKLRLQKIKRNEDRMKELGLFRSRDALAPSSLKKKAAAKARREKKQSSFEQQPLLPQRRSSRKRKSIASYSLEQVIPMYSEEEDKEEDQEKGNDETDDDDDNINSYSNSNNDDDDDDDGNQDDYQISEDENLDDDEKEELYQTVRPKKKRKTETIKPSNTKTARTKSKIGKVSTAITAFDCPNPSGGLTLEYAKSGRSKCRKCRLPIEKNKPRVGMEAWIVGRNCVTWQCPKCVFENLCCVYEQRSSGKGTCKVTHVPFTKSQLKVGIRCHTATSYYHLGAVAGVLSNVVALVMSAVNDNDIDDDEFVLSSLTVNSIDGVNKLSPKDLEKLGSVLETVRQSAAAFPNGSNRRDPTSPGNATKSDVNTKVDAEEAANDTAPETVNDDGDGDEKRSLASSSNETNKAKQAQSSSPSPSPTPPKVGVKTGARGRVQWKFGGRTCYGTLLPSKETKTHCYARTHKGNVKTLAKGKDYWSIVIAAMA